ncbi:MAG: hypothetical protein UMV23_06125, partial [Halanaerobium sp.]|nr:hypothetical protein [Halanaerobium sp.]
MVQRFNRLFQEGRIGNYTTKNRLVMAPIGNNFGTRDSIITEKQLQYYLRRARGGVGLIVTESVPVSLLGSHGGARLKVHLPGAVAELQRLVAGVQQYGTKIIMQLTHGGYKVSPEISGEYPVSASPMFLPGRQYVSRALSIEEIAGVVEEFGSAARKAEEAGFDGVQLLAASGHLIHQFLSD